MFQDFENIQFSKSHLEVENPFGLVWTKFGNSVHCFGFRRVTKIIFFWTKFGKSVHCARGRERESSAKMLQGWHATCFAQNLHLAAQCFMGL